jgi:hypothetical protein
MAVIKKGQAVTLSTSEVVYELSGDFNPTLTTLTIVLVSGTLQYTVAPSSAAPILDATYATYSTAGDKILVDMQPGSSTLRMKCASAGVVNVSW